MPDHTRTFKMEMLERRPRSVDKSKWAEGISVNLCKVDKLTDGDKKGIMQVCNYATKQQCSNAIVHNNVKWRERN